MSVLDLVSSNSASIGGNDSSFLEAAASDIEQAPQAISGDGRYVVFSSRAKNLTPQGANPTSLTQANEFVKDMVTGQVTELGQFTGAGGVLTDPNAGADYGAISDNGLFAVFLSTATNVAPPDPGLPFHTDDLFLENLTTHVITRVGPPTGVDIISTGVSNDGNTVLFTSIVNNTRSIFTKNVATGVITQIDAITAPDGTVITAPDANQSLSATLSADGRYVAFTSTATNLAGACVTIGNGAPHLFVKDLSDNSLRYFALDPIYHEASNVSISADGRFAVYEAFILFDANNGAAGIYRVDLQSGAVAVVSDAQGGTPPNGRSAVASISGDGRFVAFLTNATNLGPSDTNGVYDAYVKDMATGAVARISPDALPGNATLATISTSISSDGKYVVFTTASHLLANDGATNYDVFRVANPLAPPPTAPAGFYLPPGATDFIPAAAGSYIPFAGATSADAAILADPGFYVPTTGASAQTITPAGTFTNSLGAITPIQAPPGSYVPNEGATFATTTPPGTFTNVSGSVAPIPAPAGTYVQFAGQAAPTVTPAGSYTDVAGLSAPIPAPAGSYVPAEGATHATLAQPGFFVNTVGATAETAALPGSYVPGSGATSAITADPGYYVPTAHASAQIAAPPGTYVEFAGQAAPTITPAGTYTDTPGSVAPIPDPPGTFSAAGATAPTAFAPVLTLDSGASGADGITNAGGLTLSPPGTGASWQYSTDNGAQWSAGFTAVEGVNSVEVRHVDAQGHTSLASAPLIFTLDTIAQIGLAPASVSALSNNIYTTNSGVMNVFGLEPGSTWTYSVNNGSFVSATAPFVPGTGSSFTITGDGTKTVFVDQTDLAGNTVAGYIVVTLDTTAVLTMGLANDTGTSAADKITSDATLTGSADPGAVVSFKIDGVAVAATATADATGTWSFTPTGLTQGPHTVVANNTDLAGNAATASLAFTLDTIAQIGLAPASVSALSNNIYTTNSGVMNVFGLEPGSTWTYSVNNGSFVSATAPFVSGTGSSFTITGDGTKTVFVDQTDLAGNTVAGYIVVTLDTTAAAPVIVGPVNGSTVTTATPTISGTGEAGATVTVLIDGTAAGTALVAGSGAWNFTPSAPLSNAAHAVTATEQDIAGNVSTLSAADTFTVNTVPVNPNEAPTITSDGGAAVANLSIAENSTAVTIVHATDPDVGQTLTYTIENAPDSPDAALFTIDPNTGALSFVAAPDFEHPTDTNSDGIYGVIVKASDGQGGSSTQIIRVTVTNVNEPGTGGVTMASAVENANNTVTLTSANTITDPDGIIGSIRYQWQSFTSSSSAWTNITGATAAAFTTTAAQAGQSLRVTASYTDPFGVTMLISAETALVDRSGGNTLTGTAGRDFILGLAGNDTIIGFAGADVVNGGAGTDMIKLTATSADMNTATDAQIVNVEIISATGATAGVTIDLHNQTEGFTINGSSFGDTIQGSHGADVINTRGRADTIIGFVGADTVNGGGGFDTIVLSATSNDLNQAGNLQINNVQAVSAAVAATGVTIDLHNQTEGFAITGSAFADVLTGGNGGNTFVGFLGADTVIGGAGHDTIQLTSTSADLNSASDTQIRNIEAVSATGASAGVTIDLHNQSEGFTITGSAFADTIRGGQGADVINGGAADDTIVGFVGADTVNGGGGFDTIVLSATSANLNSASNNQIVGVEAVSAASAAAGVIIDLHNQTEAFVFTGSSFADTLVGGAGNDTISAGAGNDTLTGSGGADTFVFKADFGKDKITDFHVAATAGNPHDFVQLDHNQFSQFATVDALLASNQVTFANSGHDVVITLTNGQNSVTLQNANVTLATLQAHSSDFAFI